MKDPERISAVFEFYPTGRLKAVFLNAPDDERQRVVHEAVERLIRPNHKTWFMRLLDTCRQ